MAAAHSRQLSRIQIPPPMGQQQPFIYGENAPMFSPSLPTAIQVGAHHPFPMHGQFPLQTPMQSHFFPRQPPGAPQRPTMHRPHPSVVQLAAAGILPPPGMPMTPITPMGFPPPMLPQAFVPKSKRTQSVSTGGPPKAVLGGPQRKVSPMPPAAVVAAPAAPAPATKTKKIIVNLPKETVEEGGERGTRLPWARTPIPTSQTPSQPAVPPPEITTLEAYPPDAWRHHIPPTVDVFLPGKAAWQAIKQKAIEEKLEKLGVERGSGSGVPHIHAPHARAASISSPADPALLFFKLNKLQQSQNASANSSLAASPQLPHALSPSPGLGLPPRLQNRHGHSMSLAQPPSFYNPAAAFNPFGPSATLGSDQILSRASPGPPGITATSEEAPLHAPQGRIPTDISSLAPPVPSSRPESRPDFMRGFGLDATAEVDEPAEEPAVSAVVVQVGELDAEPEVEETTEVAGAGPEVNEDEAELAQDSVSTVAQSRLHSRHVSKLSAALSLRSVGRTVQDALVLDAPAETHMVPTTDPVEGEVDEVDGDAAAEWTGSEDLRDTSEDESIGEWSNPSDEERARQDRLQRRMLRRAQQISRDLEAPRRLPNFPRPPESGFAGANAEDDVISNPSDEEHEELRDHFIGLDRVPHFSRPGSNNSPAARPLPPLPHSRGSSAQFSYHDPALAHSREGSDQFTPGGLHPRPPRSESLNPLAKPFVFGTSLSSKSLTTITSSSSTPSHTRAPSLGKPLNVAAPEFKPGGGGFTFQPPPGVPQLTFPVAVARPLPTPPTDLTSPVRVTQGREKRQRRESNASLADDEDAEEDVDSDVDVDADADADADSDADADADANDTMASFKFPPPASLADDIIAMRHSAPVSPPGAGKAFVGSTKTFTFAGFSSSFSQNEDVPDTLIAQGNALEDVGNETVKAPHTEPRAAEELPFPPASKPKRAPIPLDFKHPVSTNTVPAGLFKALVNGDEERTRRTVRSRLSSRDIFEHSPRPSLDDLSVPPISQRKTRNRLFTDPGLRDLSADEDDMFELPRRSSLPPRHGHADSSASEASLAPVNLSRRIEMEEYEERLEILLDKKIGGVKQALDAFKRTSGAQGLSLSAENTLSEVASLFRTQLQDTAARNLADSQADARGDFDFEMLKDIIEQSHADARNVMRTDLEEFIRSSRGHDTDLKRFADDLIERTVKTVMTATSQITMHLHTMEKSRGSSATERETLVHDIVESLTPALSSLRPEPIDYEGLTAQLSQAVKPHISQLIDLASDKRETAGLIIERLVPIIPSLYPPAPKVDLEEIVGSLSAEMQRILGSLDAHDMKEQVSDLVVERLDSRLAVRDRSLSPDTIADRVADSVKMLLQPLQDIKAAVDAVSQKQSAEQPAPQADLVAVREEISQSLADIPSSLLTAVDALQQASSELRHQQDQLDNEYSAEEDMQQVRDTLEQVAKEQNQLVAQNNELSEFCQDLVKHVGALPEALLEATKVLQNAHADILERDTSKKDAEEIRKLMAANADLQVQLAKARGAHGQVRVEKDNLADRIRVVEAERDEFNSKLTAAESFASEKTDALATAERRNAELQVALDQALGKIKSYDAATQDNLARISELDIKNSEVAAERQDLRSQINKLEMSSLIAAREKEMLSEELVSVQKLNEDLLSQQSNWDELRRATEQMQSLAALFGQVDNEELKELREIREKHSLLESDHTALQRRIREQDNKIASNERAAVAARQALAQTKDRAVEWEKRAKDHEHDLRSTRDKLDELEQANCQFDEELSLVRLQLEERDAEERLMKDRESKLRDQIAALEGQLARVQAEADKANSAASTKASQNGFSAPKARSQVQTQVAAPRTRQNGYTRTPHTPARPDSRASTVFGDNGRAKTPTLQTNGIRTQSQNSHSHYASSSIRAPSPPQPSVWDSMHAPKARRTEPIRLPMTPKAGAGGGRTQSSYFRDQAPSPTPSNVSAAPTLGDDGWWV